MSGGWKMIRGEDATDGRVRGQSVDCAWHRWAGRIPLIVRATPSWAAGDGRWRLSGAVCVDPKIEISVADTLSWEDVKAALPRLFRALDALAES